MSRITVSRKAVASVFALACATTQVAAQMALGDSQTQACRATVAKFERSIWFLRQSMGNEEAAKVKDRLMPAKLEAEILQQEGYCGLARYMQEKKLVRD